MADPRKRAANLGIPAAAGFVAWALWLGIVQAQSIVSLDNGLKQFTQGQLTLITDLPIDDELRQWPEVLNQAIAEWSQRWGVEPSAADALHLTALVIGDRSRFQSQGMLDGVPPFEDGYQKQDTIFLNEQPSTYYRRHLFLHEATHWIMFRFLGGAGAPWFMEGMADLDGTHLWSGGKLVLGIIPSDPLQVPHWGRFKRLHDMLEREVRPSLNQILNYGNETNNRMDRYVWSWAACVFFNHHPEYQKLLAEASHPPLDYSLTLSKRFRESLQDRWPTVVREWNGFLTDFDFGYDPSRSMVVLDPQSFQMLEGDGQVFERVIDAQRGWQSTGLSVAAGQEITILADGSYGIARFDDGRTWRSEPQGVTLRYINHQPLGRLLATIVPLGEGEQTHPWESIPVGRNMTIQAPTDGWLLLKVNEPAGQLFDNEGSLRVVIQAL